MASGRCRWLTMVAGLFVAVAIAPPAHGVLNGDALKCMLANAKASQKFVAAKLKLLAKCRDANLKDGSCAMPDAVAVGKLHDQLVGAIAKACPLLPDDFELMGFPGACADANPGDGFTLADLQTCMETVHDAFVAAALDLAYDPTLTTPVGDDLGCQREIGKRTTGFASCVLTNVAKCRSALLKGKPLGIPPDYCATKDPKTAAAIAKCKNALTAGIAKKCTPTQVASLKVCTPDQTDPAGAATCLVDATTVLVDGPEIAVPPDLIDYEYAVRGGLCGDNVVNSLDEECDGTDDAACPGQCGTATTPDGFFACLCKTKPRMRIAEHANADSDVGFTGQSSDTGVAEGGGFLVDLYDCDITGLCNVGPSCSLPPHSPCAVPMSAPSGTTSDSICAAFGQGVCRKERTATGPHCFQDVGKKCDLKNRNDVVCNAPGDYCATTYFGTPVPAAAGGVAVCTVSTLSEDVVGTTNLVDGTASLKLRRRAVTLIPITQDKPCPVCGGFCGVDRARCASDTDCGPGLGPCITEPVCSDGLRKDKSCRPNPPLGGEITFFGVTSVDCPPDTGLITSSTIGGLDININPRTTGTVTLTPSFPCTQTGFTTNRCVGGSSEGRTCTVASECPGGSCTGQCFCAGQKRPNDCAPACVGGASDAALCASDADCPGGFCHPADCRPDPADVGPNRDGICTSGPNEGFCSTTTYHPCGTDADCAPPGCPFCQGGETCVFRHRACFINSGISRTGTPGTTERVSVGAYCVPSNSPGIDASAGLPGPAALVQPEKVIAVP